MTAGEMRINKLQNCSIFSSVPWTIFHLPFKQPSERSWGVPSIVYSKNHPSLVSREIVACESMYFVSTLGLATWLLLGFISLSNYWFPLIDKVSSYCSAISVWQTNNNQISIIGFGSQNWLRSQYNISTSFCEINFTLDKFATNMIKRGVFSFM